MLQEDALRAEGCAVVRRAGLVGLRHVVLPEVERGTRIRIIVHSDNMEHAKERLIRSDRGIAIGNADLHVSVTSDAATLSDLLHGFI